MTPMERFMAKVEKTDDCWVWTAALGDDGYARFRVDGVLRLAHRWSYEQFQGPIPDGLGLDHLCHTRDLIACVAAGGKCAHRRCVNPAHLEPVTARENVLRGAITLPKRRTCRIGHDLTPTNTITSKYGWKCRTCWNAYLAALRKRAS